MLYGSTYSAKRYGVYISTPRLRLTWGQTWLIFIPAFYSFFYGGTMGTYLSLHFSVRARALSTLITRKFIYHKPFLFKVSHIFSLHYYRNGSRLWQTAGYETMVSKSARMDSIRHLGHSSVGMFHLDRHRIQQIWD